MATEVSLVDVPEWKALQDHHKVAKEWHMRDMFVENPKRFQEFRYKFACISYIEATSNLCLLFAVF